MKLTAIGGDRDRKRSKIRDSVARVLLVAGVHLDVVFYGRGSGGAVRLACWARKEKRASC